MHHNIIFIEDSQQALSLEQNTTTFRLWLGYTLNCSKSRLLCVPYLFMVIKPILNIERNNGHYDAGSDDQKYTAYVSQRYSIRHFSMLITCLLFVKFIQPIISHFLYCAILSHFHNYIAHFIFQSFIEFFVVCECIWSWVEFTANFHQVTMNASSIVHHVCFS